MKLAKIGALLLLLIGGALSVWGVTWLAGAEPTEEALLRLDQRRLDAFASRTLSATPPELKVVRYMAFRRVVWPGAWYYRGVSCNADGPISDHAPRSLV